MQHPSTGEIRCLPDGSTVVRSRRGPRRRVPRASRGLGCRVEVFKARATASMAPGGAGTLGGDPSGSHRTLRIACAWPDGDDPRLEMSSLPLSRSVRRSRGLLHLDERPCDCEGRTYPDDPAYGAYVEGNDQVAMPEVTDGRPGDPPDGRRAVRRYPEAEDAFRQWAVTREGQLVALVRDPRPLQGVWRFGPLETCGDAGIEPVTPRRASGSVRRGRITRDAIPMPPCVVAYVEEPPIGCRVRRTPTHLACEISRAATRTTLPVDCAGQPGGTLRVALRLSPTAQASFVDRFGCGRVTRGPLPGIGRRTRDAR